MNKRIEATVYGHVQGVYFRYYTQREAMRLSLTGWVTNVPDGTVAVVAEGAQTALLDLERFLVKGSPGAHVDRVSINWHEATGDFSQFNIRGI